MSELAGSTPRHFVSYAFFSVDPSWRTVAEEERSRMRDEFANLVEGWGEQMMVRSFSTVGTRADCDLLLWRATPDFDQLQQMQTELMSTDFGARYLRLSYCYTATTKESQYRRDVASAGFTRPRPLDVVPADRRYIIVYPFVKQRSWYTLSSEERGAAMREHALVGRKYPGIKLNTAYSFGIDDQEFMVAFETDSVQDFLDLMMELRPTTASAYTERDTPIFTCTSMSVGEAIEALGGIRTRAVVGG